ILFQWPSHRLTLYSKCGGSSAALTLMKGGMSMEDYEEMASTRLDQPPVPRRHGRGWFLIGGLALAFMLALGVGMLMSWSTGTTQAATLASGSTGSSQTLTFAPGSSNNAPALTFAQGSSNSAPLAATPGTRGQCDALTVS